MLDCISKTAQVLTQTRKMTPATLAIFFVSLVIIGTATDVAPATKQPFEFFPSLQEHDKSLFVTVEGTIVSNTSSRK